MFEGIEYKMEELFYEIEHHINYNLRYRGGGLRGRSGTRGSLELKRLLSTINYEGSGGLAGKGRGREMERRGGKGRSLSIRANDEVGCSYL